MIGTDLNDWRGSLETAIAYRMVEQKSTLTPDAAWARVRDVAKYGANSVYYKDVVAAAVDLYGSVIAQLIPFARGLIQSVIVETEAQNRRGRAVEIATESRLR